MKILFLHGWHSVARDAIPKFLTDAGYEVIDPELDDGDYETALQVAQAEFDRQQPDLVLGAAFGGAVAMNIQSGDTPLILMRPAWKNWGTVRTLKPNSMVLHSRRDHVIRFTDSEELVANSGLSPETLIEVEHDQRLADEAVLSVIGWECRLLESQEQLPWLDDASDGPVISADVGDLAPQEDASYVCDACGEEIVIPLDLTEGSNQQYLEDCPVCCRANIIHVEINDVGDALVWAEPEQDYK